MSGLPQNLISDFVKSVTDDDKKSTPTTAYGTIVMHEGEKKVLLDGSDAEPIPLISTVLANPGDRVKVTIQNHYAIIDGNITSPAVNKDGVIASINLSGETATISASRIDLKGVATFSNGGGVNFLRNTGHVQTWRQLMASTSEFIDDRTVRINKMETDDDWNSGVQTWPRLDTLELFGKTVTLSFWAKIVARSQTIDSRFTIVFSTSASSGKTGERAKYKAVGFTFPLYDEESGEFIPIDTWKKFTYTIENVSADFFSSGSGNVGGYFYLGIYNRSPNRFYFKDFKIEEGHAATTWSPSPLDDNYSVVEDGVTVIDGGKIKTGSITANQIKAGTITGAEIKAGSISAGELDVESIFARDIFARGYISFQNSKYNFTASDVTGDITIEGKTNGSDITIRAKSDLNLMNEGGDISLSAANAITFDTGYLGDVYIERGTTRYKVEAAESGKSGIWLYKKYTDGTVELWGYKHITTSTECRTAFGAMYRTDSISINNYPFDVYHDYVQVSCDCSGAGALPWATGRGDEKSPSNYYLIRPTASTLSDIGIHFYVRGTLTN